MKRLLAVVAAFAVFAVGYTLWVLSRPVEFSSSSVEITIPAGTSVSGAVDILAEHEVLSSPFIHKVVAVLYTRLGGRHIQQGVFEIQNTQTQFEAVKSLFLSPATVDVTFPEGIGLEQFASIAARAIGCDSAAFMRFATSDSVCRAHNIPARTVEGYLLPNTYNFFRKSRASVVVDRLLAEQETLWRKEFGDKKSIRGRSKHEILTLASIVEAETPAHDEKPRVSGVYHNRLQRGMKLQADPTVQYALGGKKQRILYRDLEVDNPYNTYRYYGLPPGPINSPGIDAIRAAVQPEQHNYLYFVATGDGSNRHRFARNDHEHQRNVALYRATRR